jgi:hypothetical protein
MKSFIRRFGPAALLLAVVLLSGCNHEDVPSLQPSQADKSCAVLIRGDVAAGVLNTHIGKNAGIVGTFKRATADWIVIEKDGGEFWIPKSVIVFVQLGGTIQTQ